MEAQFLDHYNRELGYLRELGAEFAQEYPAVAGRLGMDEFACADPFVERLLEGFAFLAARVHRRLDSEFPQLTGGLLQSIYPHYTRPIPAAAVVEIHPDPDEGSLVDGYRLPRGSRLQGPTSHASPTPCRFETTADLDLWPIKITDVELIERGSANTRPLPSVLGGPEVRSGLRITLETTGGVPMSALKMDRLPIHLRGGEIAHQLLELLVAHTTSIAVGQTESGRWDRLDRSALSAGGFDDSESLLPDEPRSFSGYRLLQEYFLLPEKFLFVNIEGLSTAIATANGKQIEIVIGLGESERELASRLAREHFALHCVPAINLFKKRADRVQISEAKSEHQLLVDRSRPMDFEIWSVQQLLGHGRTPLQEVEFLPLYAPPTNMAARHQHAAYYTLDRRPRQPSTNQREYGHRSSYLGTEVYVTLTDSNQAPSRHPIRQLSSTVYCTNRDLAMLKPASGWRDAFTLDGPGPVASISCLTGPTTPRQPLTTEDGETCWRLVNHLTSNFLSLCDRAKQSDKVGTESDQRGRSAAALLRQMLYLYCPADLPATRRQVDGILSVTNEAVTRQLPFDGPIVHGRGVHLDLELDEAAFEGGGAFLMGAVLDQFMARFVSLNSFTQTTIRTPSRGRVHRWPVRTGTISMI
ncbi:hypothetical protein K227x_23530 [Rubripirellula lacrimiformis]|uniref:Type VI secretion protein, VC_A0110 family n=1 Tax=Rubripirellula lacrimiformis TaxID=1930273 RepID=A0A517NA06_9BACT|nr:type VI secretion system baseplate subunit TssF [Rubripirellula lacrimiformis]QDT03967.1 hypothetical protein K227x_23530 [Rubripirellula lacrimiformis]